MWHIDKLFSQKPVIRSSRLDRRHDLQMNHYPTGPNELTRHDLSAAPNGAFTRPVKRQQDIRETNHAEKEDRIHNGEIRTKPYTSRESDDDRARVSSESEIRGGKSIETSRSEMRVDLWSHQNGRGVPLDDKHGQNRDRAVYDKGIGNRSLSMGDIQQLSDRRTETERTSSRSADTDPIRSHLLDTNRFYRSHLWRELPPRSGDRSFRPITPRTRPNRETWTHEPRQIDSNRSNRAFRPVTPRRQRHSDHATFPQSPSRCASLIPSPESLLQTQIKALQSQSLHENVINKEQNQQTGELLRGLGTWFENLNFGILAT